MGGNEGTNEGIFMQSLKGSVDCSKTSEKLYIQAANNSARIQAVTARLRHTLPTVVMCMLAWKTKTEAYHVVSVTPKLHVSLAWNTGKTQLSCINMQYCVSLFCTIILHCMS